MKNNIKIIMIMPINLVLSYIVSFIGVKYIYKGLNQKSLVSLGLFIGSIIALITLVIYLLSGMQDLYIPIIFGGLLIFFEYYSLRNYGNDMSQSEVFSEQTIENDKINMFLGEEKNDEVNMISSEDSSYQKTQNSKELTIDDLIK